MGIKIKIILGFVILASLLVISGMISIYELTKLGDSVTTLLDDNYKSIEYAKNMSESLSHQKKSFLVAINEGTIPSFTQYDSAKVFFEDNLRKASNNLTIPDEIAYVDSIAIMYSRFTNTADSLIAFHSFIRLDKYMSEILPQIEAVESKIEELLTLNQQTLVQTASTLHHSPFRTILPGLIVIISSIAFAIIFNYMINYYLILPIIKITKGINDNIKYKRSFDITLDTKDEVFNLKEAVKNLINLKNTPKS